MTYNMTYYLYITTCIHVKLGVKKKTHNKEKKLIQLKTSKTTKKTRFLLQTDKIFKLGFYHRKYTRVKHKQGSEVYLFFLKIIHYFL